MRTGSYGDPAMEELAAAWDSDELRRLPGPAPVGMGTEHPPPRGRQPAARAPRPRHLRELEAEERIPAAGLCKSMFGGRAWWLKTE